MSRRWIAALLLAIGLPAFGLGCFGRFELTRKVYGFNREISGNKWVRWIAFLVMWCVPVYEIGIMIDIFLINSLEFWTGDNPLAAAPGATRTALGPRGEVVTATRLADGSVRLEVREASGALHVLRIAVEPDGVAAYAPSGELLARVREQDGRPVLLRR